MRWARTSVWRALALVLCFGCAPVNAADQILTVDGLGPVRIGMTQRQAERVLGSRLKSPFPSERRNICWNAIRTDRVDPWIYYVILNGRIASIDVTNGALGGPIVLPPIATDKGIRIGDTDAKVKEAYGTNVNVRVHSQVNTEDEGSVITALTSDKGRGFVFVTSERKVVEVRAGLPDAIEMMEGCEHN